MSRDGGLYEAALDVLRKGTSAEARRAALAYLGERGVDEYSALVEASRPLPQGVPGSLRKAVGTAGGAGAYDITLRWRNGSQVVTFDMDREACVGLVNAAMDALGGRRA